MLYSPKPPLGPRPKPSWSLKRRYSMIIPKLNCFLADDDVTNNDSNKTIGKKLIKIPEFTIPLRNLKLLRLPELHHENPAMKPYTKPRSLLRLYPEIMHEKEYKPILYKPPVGQGLKNGPLLERMKPTLLNLDTEMFSYGMKMTDIKLIRFPNSSHSSNSHRGSSAVPNLLKLPESNKEIYTFDLIKSRTIPCEQVERSVSPFRITYEDRELQTVQTPRGDLTSADLHSIPPAKVSSASNNTNHFENDFHELDKPLNHLCEANTANLINMTEADVQFDYYLDTDDFLPEMKELDDNTMFLGSLTRGPLNQSQMTTDSSFTSRVHRDKEECFYSQPSDFVKEFEKSTTENENNSQLTRETGTQHVTFKSKDRSAHAVRTVSAPLRQLSSNTNKETEHATTPRSPHVRPSSAAAIRQRDRTRRVDMLHAKRRADAEMYAKQVLAECCLNVTTPGNPTKSLKSNNEKIPREENGLLFSPSERISLKIPEHKLMQIPSKEHDETIELNSKENQDRKALQTSSDGPGTSTAMRSDERDEDLQTTVISDWSLESNVKRILYSNETERFKLSTSGSDASKRLLDSQAAEKPVSN